MSKNTKYSSYNQIIKEFDVYIMQIGKDQYSFKLVKHQPGPDKPKPPRESKPPKWFREYMDQFRQEINDRFNSIEDRLDKHDHLFKTHGWIK